MTHLRIEHVNGEIHIKTESGEMVEADMVTITLTPGSKARILVDSKKEGRRVRIASKFFANAGD